MHPGSPCDRGQALIIEASTAAPDGGEAHCSPSSINQNARKSVDSQGVSTMFRSRCAQCPERAEFGGERCAMNRRGSLTGSDPTQTPMRHALNQLPVGILQS